MVNYQQGGGGSSMSAGIPPLGIRGTQNLAKGVKDLWSPTYFGGDFNSPVIKALMKIAGGKASTEEQTQRGQILSTPGLSSSAKASAVSGLAEKAIRATAEVPTNVYDRAAKAVEGLLGPINVSRSSQEKTSGGGICCYIFCAAHPTDEMLGWVRKYKDEHYHPASTVAQGYKRLALHLVPLMSNHKWVEKVVRWTMVGPMEEYARAYYERDWATLLPLWPLAQGWVTLYRIVGVVAGVVGWQRYWELERYFEED